MNLALLTVVFTSSALAQGQTATIEPIETWTNVLASTEMGSSKEKDVHFVIKSQTGWSGRLSWSLSVNKAVVERRDIAVHASAGKPHKVKIPLRLPFVRDGLVGEGEFAVALVRDGDRFATASYQKPLWIFPPQPFFQRAGWLRNLNIVLYDPRESTAPSFKKMNIPFTTITNPAELADLKKGVVVIGEGVSFEDEPTLGNMLLKAAAAGLPVLCLAPTRAQLPIPQGMDGKAPEGVFFKDTKVITWLDKRFDERGWPPDGKTLASGVMLKAVGGVVVGDIANAGTGWPWFEMHYPGGGRLVICGLGIMSHWEAGPTPRYLLARMLEHLTRPSPEAPG